MMWLSGLRPKDFTPAVRKAWTVCYDELAGEMKAAVGV
jgi:hypothetical protein